MRVASVQVAIQDRPKQETLRHVLALLDQTRGSDLVLLPEMWPCGYFAFDTYQSASEPIDGPTVQALSAKARELKSYLLMGSFVERSGSDLFNTAVLLDSRGELAGRYRKMHLFGFGDQESGLLRRGKETTVVATPFGRVGLSICYDLRFPELYRRMVDQGAEIFLVTSAWPRSRRDAWVLFNKARAHENLAYLFSCNCAGAQAGQQYGGHSLFVDPLGKIIAEGGDEETIVAAAIDPGLVATVRREFPALSDRTMKSP
jgi:predicted amidohydrolase